MLSPELDAAGTEALFERGDFCSASIHNGQIVGHTFYSRHDTQVRPGLVFLVPDQHSYSFKGFTSAKHRGRKLEPERWKAARAHSIKIWGTEPPRVFYVNVANLESLAAGEMSETKILGHCAYARLFGKLFTYNSRSCQKHGTGFALTN